MEQRGLGGGVGCGFTRTLGGNRFTSFSFLESGLNDCTTVIYKHDRLSPEDDITSE